MKLPRYVHNWISYLGAGIAGVALLSFGFLLILDTLADGHKPYASLVIFIIVPSFLLFGLGLIPLGMLREWRFVARTGSGSLQRLPVLDLNDARSRNATAIFVVGTIGLLFLSAFGSFEAYEYTESVAFCGTTCHSVMAPEHTAYLQSPHARVRCVDCHVGEGADYYVKSKLNGLNQVYSLLLDKVPRPIPVPVHNLRPAQDTCEQCHWPEQFHGYQQRRQAHFLSDDANSRWEIDLLIKTGGGGPNTASAGGIHWHMNTTNRVEYIARDPQRQDIPWVRTTDVRTGAVREFSADESLSAADILAAPKRTMDCVDCHNRPAHIYRSPRTALNLSLAMGRIDPSLVGIKREAAKVLTQEYETGAAALAAIESGLTDFYAQQEPDPSAERRAAITQAITEVKAIYSNNFFPEMKVRWDAYPDNIGHFRAPGCFRCHDGNHRSSDGTVLSNDCDLCHSIVAQGKPGEISFAQDRTGLKFVHPGDDVGDAWEAMPCYECHTGGAT